MCLLLFSRSASSSSEIVKSTQFDVVCFLFVRILLSVPLSLSPSPSHFLSSFSSSRYLKHEKVPLNEYEFPTSKISNVQSQLEMLVEKNYYLHRSAKVSRARQMEGTSLSSFFPCF